MESTTQRQAPPSPVKPSPLTISPEEFMDTPSSSATASPAESCASDVGKQPKPWERSSSDASSVNSTETSELLCEDAGNDAEERPEGSIVVASGAKALNMQTHLRAMQRRLDGLQRLMQEATQQGRFRSQLHSVPVAEESVDAGESADLQRRAAPKERGDKRVQLTSASPSESAESAPSDEANDSRDDQQDSSSSSSDEDGPPAIITLLNRIKTLQAQLKEATDENQQLQNTVQRLEEENARLQGQTAFKPEKDIGCDNGSKKSGGDQESSAADGDEAGEGHDGSISRLTTAIFGAPSAFQMVMKEDLQVLKNHERCQHKLHELWDVILTLRTFVETYELERNAMRIQRDEAIADAERADAENVKLASSSNPQQKIKYLQQVKKDNQALRRKNRALNMRVAKQAAKFIQEKNGYSLKEDGTPSIDTTWHSTTLDDTLVQECDEPSAVRTGEEIVRSMLDRSGVLEQRLEHLRLARQSRPEVDEDDNSSGEEVSVSESELRTDSAAVIGQRPAATSAQ